MLEAPRVIVALDLPSKIEAMRIVDRLDPALCRLKVANTMFTHYGPEFVKTLIAAGFSVFLDLKYYDIPSQVAGACRSAAELGVWMVNLHVSGGLTMMRAAVDALQQFSPSQRPLLIGVTILTSMDASDLAPLGLVHPIKYWVLEYTKLAEKAGLDGVVCSAQEASDLRAEVPENFLLVTPGIRLSDNETADQKRIMTPEKAIEQGASYLVVGRPITESRDPLAALKTIDQRVKDAYC